MLLRAVAGIQKRQGNRVFSLRGLGAIAPEKQVTERGVTINGEKSVWRQAILVQSFAPPNNSVSTSAAT